MAAGMRVVQSESPYGTTQLAIEVEAGSLSERRARANLLRVAAEVEDLSPPDAGWVVVIDRGSPARRSSLRDTLVQQLPALPGRVYLELERDSPAERLRARETLELAIAAFVAFQLSRQRVVAHHAAAKRPPAQPVHPYVAELLAAGKAETPRPGAAGKALDAVLALLCVGMDRCGQNGVETVHGPSCPAHPTALDAATKAGGFPLRVVGYSDEVRTRGFIRFMGRSYEPARPNTMISPKDTVAVQQAEQEDQIHVRKVLSDGSLGGRETWEVM